MKINWIRSPNYFANTGEKTAIVIHKTLGLMPGTLNWLTKKKSRVSSHYLITKKGIIYQLVKRADGAWHCGVEVNPSERWMKLDKPGVNNNRYTFGIEFECLLHETFTEKQYEAGTWLLATLNANANNLVTHRDIYNIKPNLELERDELLARLDNPPPEPDKQSLIELLKIQIRILMMKIQILKGRKKHR